MTAPYASDREHPGDSISYGASRQAGSGPRRTPDGRHHRRYKRSRPRLTLLDYPDSEGITRELVIGASRRLGRSKKALFAITATAIVALGAVFGGRAALRSSGTGPAPDIRVPLLAPFPSLTASGSAPPLSASGSAPPFSAGNSSPPLAVNLRGSQLMPSVAPGQNAMAAMSSTPSATPAVTPSTATTTPQQTVAVTYLVVSQWDDGFEGEVYVVNNGSAPIANWQIAIALPGDSITSFWGASGYISNHILLLQPAAGAGPLAADGQLRVFFAAEGTQETPELCAFDNIACG